MTLGGDSIPLFGFWYVLLMILLIIAGTYLLVGYWQRKIPQLLKKFPLTFNQLQTEFNQVLVITQQYSADDPLPYGPLMVEINRQLDEVTNKLVELRNHYVLVQTLIHRITFIKWKILIGAPFTVLSWFRVRNEVNQFQDEFEQIEEDIDALREKTRVVMEQAWRVASRARRAIEQEKEIRRLMEYLSERKFSGNAFESAAAQEEQVIEWLEKIPSYFFAADASDLSFQASKEDVCELYGLLNLVEPSLKELSEKLTSWRERYIRLEEELGRVNQRFKNVERFLYHIPAELVVSDEKNRLQLISKKLRSLRNKLQKFEVESLDAFERDLNQCQQGLIESGGLLRKGLKQFQALIDLIDDLERRQRECSEEFSNLVKSQRYPVLLDLSHAIFLKINKSLAELGSNQKTRLIGDVEAELERAEELSTQLDELIEQIQTTKKHHNTLLILMDSEEIQKCTSRLEEYRHLASQIAEYHPDNWQKRDAAAVYLEDTISLQSRFRSELIRDFSEVIPESRLDELVRKCSTLIHDLKLLQARTERIRERLEWLKNIETSARDQYNLLRSALNQIAWLVNSNSFLRQLAEAELARLRREVEKIGQELNQPQHGVIEKKARSVREATESALTVANGWLEQLNRDISRRSSVLADLVERLHDMAILDDPAILKARKILAREERRSSQAQYLAGVYVEMDALVAELRGRNAVWQEFVAVQQELEEIVAAPLRDAVAHAEKQRNLALVALSEANQIIPEQRAWPPCSVSLSGEKQRMEELEKQWKSLKSKPTRAIWAVRMYGELAAGYQEIIGKVARAREWASQEQKRIRDIETEIERLNSDWKRQEQMFGRDPIAAEQIRRLRVQSIQAVTQLKQDWLSASSSGVNLKSYDDVLRLMMEIARSLRNAVVPAQDERGEPIEIRVDRQQEIDKSP